MWLIFSKTVPLTCCPLGVPGRLNEPLVVHPCVHLHPKDQGHLEQYELQLPNTCKDHAHCDSRSCCVDSTWMCKMRVATLEGAYLTLHIESLIIRLNVLPNRFTFHKPLEKHFDRS